MQSHEEFNAAVRRHYESFIQPESKKSGLLIGQKANISVPDLDAANFGYHPVGGELLLAVHSNITRLKLQNSGNYSWVGITGSVRIVKGLYVRFGKARIAREKTVQPVDGGRLIVTSKAIVFEGGGKNERWTWGQIAGIEVLFDGYQIKLRRGRHVVLGCRTPDPRTAALLTLLSSMV